MAAGDRAFEGVLAAVGVSAGELLGAGVEGSVFDLRDGTVAKVWTHRTLAELDSLRAFYDAVAAAGPAVETPRILRVLSAEDVVVSVEARLSGEPVWRADGSSPDLTTAQIDAMIAALIALADIPAVPAFRSLPILPDEAPPPADLAFEAALAGLVERRVRRFGAALRAALPSIHELADQTCERLRGLSPAAARLVHGDLIAANVLTRGRSASAILDFGFLTTAGDPAFDAAVAASCFDMYGPRSRETERDLDAAFAPVFGYDRRRLAIYRAAYALATACCFGDTLDEGHFAWCIAMVSRPAVAEALG